METSWWWVSMPRATCAIHSTDLVIDKTPPYMRFSLGMHIYDLMENLKPQNDVRVVRMEDRDEQEEKVRHS